MPNPISQIYDEVMEGNSQILQGAVNIALEAGLNPEIILNKGMIDAMTEVGSLFEEGEYFVPEMLISDRAM